MNVGVDGVQRDGKVLLGWMRSGGVEEQRQQTEVWMRSCVRDEKFWPFG